MMKFFVSICIVICGLGFAGGLYYQQKMNHHLDQEVSMEISSGEGFYTAIRKLRQIDPKISFRITKFYLKLNKLENSLKPGEYSFQQGTSLTQVINDMSTGNVVKYKVTIPEGYNSFEIADLLVKQGIIKSKKAFIDYVHSPKTAVDVLGYKARGLEGYLYPATYEFSKNTKIPLIVKSLVEAHQNNYDGLMKEVTLPKDFSHHDLVTLASVVEKETGASHERPLIASVFLNRLKKRMRLQSDPTTIYGQWIKTGERLFNIRKRHLLEKNDFNTYAIRALPAGPISNPGVEALRAVCKPKESPYLYFVSRNDGTHYFSKTYKEHSDAVRKFQMSRKARAGKSWRDLKNKKGS